MLRDGKMIARFRKKPVVVEAFRWQGEEIDGLERRIIERWTDRDGKTFELCQLAVPTLEGTLFADRGDWIVTGTVGEVYPVKDTIFRAIYEPANLEGERALKGLPYPPGWMHDP